MTNMQLVSGIVLLLASTLVFADDVLTYHEVSIDVPKDWRLTSSVIEDEFGKKIGEFHEFFSARELSAQQLANRGEAEASNSDGLVKLVEQGQISNHGKQTRWNCTEVAWEGSYGDIGMWFPRTFYLEVGAYSFGLTFYSQISCQDGFERISRIVRSARVAPKVPSAVR